MEYSSSFEDEMNSTEILEDSEIIKDNILPEDKWIDSIDNENGLQEELKEKDKQLIFSDKNDSDTTIETKSNKTSYTFLWTEGGNEVKLTGSFANWKQHFLMAKDSSDGIFKFKIPLNKDIYQYKFIIDGEWKCSSSQPTIKDACGNINNLLDLTKKKSKAETIKLPSLNSGEKKKKKDLPSEYGGDYFTQKLEMSGEVPSAFDWQKEPFSIEYFSNQPKIGHQKYLSYYQKVSNSIYSSFKPLLSHHHINLEHLFSYKKDKASSHKTGICFRYREKATTLIYYVPFRSIDYNN